MLLNDIFTEADDAKYFKDQVRGTEKAKTVKPQPHKGSQPHPFQGRLVGGESIDSNPTDKVTMDIPLFLRMMEYAKEDAKTDMDLHNVTERAIELMQQHDYLCMDNYNDLVGGEATGGEQPTNEAANENSLKDFLPPYSANGLWVSDRRGNSVLEVTRHGKVAQQVADALNQYSSTNEFKDTAQYGDDSGKNINHEIFQLLKNGATVYSNAAGRMGKVLRANNDGVVIASKRGKGFTSFNSGDPVKIKQDENEPNTYHIINEEKKGLYYYVNKRKKAGTSRSKNHPKAPSAQDWKNAAKTAKEDIEPTDEGWLDKAYAAGRNFADTATLGGYKYARAGADYAVKNAMNQLGLDDEGTTYQKELDQEVEKLNKDWEQEPAASLAGMGGALAIPVAGEYGAAVKGAQGLAGQALDTYSKAVKMYPLAKAALGFKDMKNPKVEDVELEENLLSRIAGLVGAYYGAQMGIPDAIMSTMDMPLGTYELTQHILGGVAGYALGATMSDVAIGSLKALTKRMLRGALNKAMQSIKGGTPQDQAWKNYEAEVKAQYEKIKAAAEQGNKKEPKLFDKTTTEGKIKGVDGKACWPGKRYAGKEKKADGTYKDICVPVKKGK